MGLSIKNPEVERLVRKVARERGMTLTEAIEFAMRQVEEKPKKAPKYIQEERRKAIRELQEKVAQRPIDYSLTEDEILGYDEYGIPTK